MKLNKRKIILFIISCCVLIVLGWVYYNFEEAKNEVVFFDVGQGDAFLINLPGNNEILIDGGPGNKILYKLGEYLPIYNQDIELMVLTHPHADHLDGLVEVLKRYKVKKVLLTGVKYNSIIYDEFLKIISEQEIEILNAGLLGEINLDKENLLEIIYPWENFSGRKFKNQNDNSIVLKLKTASKSFLFTGDMEMNIENNILKHVNNKVLKVDILKVGHHGSKTSSGKDFIDIVKPDIGIISCGENNKFGHPSLRTVRRLEREGVEVLRTDELGNIVVKIEQQIFDKN